MPIKRASAKTKSDDVFGQVRRRADAAGTITLQVREVNSGAARREAREKLLEAAPRREIDVVLVWPLDRPVIDGFTGDSPGTRIISVLGAFRWQRLDRMERCSRYCRGTLRSNDPVYW